jgi:hypothetical protein
MQIRVAWSAAFVVLAACSPAQDLFDGQARHNVKKTFKEDVHMDVSLPQTSTHRGAWQVRATAQGSKWLYDYQRSQPPMDEDHATWPDWIDAKMEYDRAAAAKKADVLNGHAQADSDSQEEAPADTNFGDLGSVGGMEDLGDISGPNAGVSLNGRIVENPGRMPEDMKMFMNGRDVTFYAAVKPQLYKISYGGDAAVAFVDQATVPDRYLYFRSNDGVISGGTPLKTMSDDDVSNLLQRANIDPSTWHVMRAVSSLEGGFDSINTYDTGYISCGFIQFTTGASGAGSLAKVLLKEKTENAEAFGRDFRRFGIEVTDKGVLDVFDPNSDAELVGPDAVQAVIKDKRLTGVFVHAGRESSAFKVAQLELAKDRYYAGDDMITLKLGDKKTQVRVGDVIKSEAGLATIMDRKVNTGNVGPLTSVMQRIADDVGASSAQDLMSSEDQIVAAVKFRRDFLSDPTLSQPGGIPADLGSRGGNYPRGSRKKKKPSK